MTCETAEKLVLLEDSGELTGERHDALITHLTGCNVCQDYKLSIMKSKLALPSVEEPDATLVQYVLREARLMAPNKKALRIYRLRPALAMAASLVVALGFFFSSFGPGEVGMEMDVTETQLMESSDQIVDVMYSGLSEDDLAFNFLMTFEEV
jgi:hypothetical protein